MKSHFLISITKFVFKEAFCQMCNDTNQKVKKAVNSKTYPISKKIFSS